MNTKVNSNVGLLQCISCGFMEDDFSYFHLVNSEDEVVCVGCYDKYMDACDIMIGDE